MYGMYTTCRCVHCIHLHLDAERSMTCEAFPDGIPDWIINGKFDHRRPCRDNIGYVSGERSSEQQKSGAA